VAGAEQQQCPNNERYQQSDAKGEGLTAWQRLLSEA
jgi:hypothetical protein|tara:strand:+ start:721 stop:828 length:108 start_codon:yes stop_codon:yes gene_type:complete